MIVRPDTGRIVVDGRDISTLSSPKRNALGGSIAKAQENMAELTPEDREAMAACLESVPPIANERSKKRRPRPSWFAAAPSAYVLMAAL